MKSGQVSATPTGSSNASRCWVLLFCAVVLGVCSALPAYGQIHGTPASVTSLGPSGEIRGIPASVTSLGPFGWQAPRHPLPPGFQPRLGQFYGRRRAVGAYGYGSVLPYAPGIVYYDEGSYGNVTPSYLETPALSGADPRTLVIAVPAPAAAAASAPAPAPSAAPQPDVTPQPQTLLVFRDGHRLEVANYAIVGDKLYDLTGGRRRTIALDDLDLAATRRLNEERGTDFLLPAAHGG